MRNNFWCEILNSAMEAQARIQAAQAPPLTRRQKLELWRKQTGRTPMKRWSYVQECVGKERCHGATNYKACQRPPPVSKPITTPASKSKPCSREKTESKVLQPLRESNITETAEAVKPKLSRREMLEQWIAVHGSTVKRPRSYLPGRVPGQQVERTRRRPPKRRHTISSRPVFRLRESLDNEADCREALRKQFQNDIDETVAELMQSMDCQWVGGTEEGGMEEGGMEEGGMEEGDLVSRRLDFDFEMASSEQGDERECQWPTNHFGVTPVGKCKRKRNVLKGQVFKSSTIRYSMALSEPRKRRHSCATPDVYRKRILHLTPVRRSTRKNRQGPGMELDKNLCFDSPSEACTLEEFENVEVVPNQALV